jgi:hypothetical protein
MSGGTVARRHRIYNTQFVAEYHCCPVNTRIDSIG